MDAQLETLLQIQDLRAQRQELTGEGGERLVQEREFHLDIAAALEALDEKIAQLEADLDPRVRSRYQRMSALHPRVVAPAIQGTCYGCFVSVPTAVASDAAGHGALPTCDQCGRFLYFVR